MSDTAGFLAADWPAPANIRAGTTLRSGGASVPPFDTLNLGDRAGDDPGAVEINRERIRTQLDLPAAPAWLYQVHGTGVVDAASAPTTEADASVAHDADGVCAVLTADCLPVLFCNRAGSAWAAAHAGWRGLSAGVLEATVATMDARPGELLAWLGPSIGAHNFEVGEDVRQAFYEAAPEDVDAFTAGDTPGKYLADIYALARARLKRVGVTAIYGGGLCTIDDEARFFSYRRDGARTGRMASLIWSA